MAKLMAVRYAEQKRAERASAQVAFLLLTPRKDFNAVIDTARSSGCERPIRGYLSGPAVGNKRIRPASAS